MADPRAGGSKTGEIGQLQPHTEVRFVEVDMAEALKARHDYEARLERLRRAMAN